MLSHPGVVQKINAQIVSMIAGNVKVSAWYCFIKKHKFQTKFTRKIESIIGVQSGQENPSLKVHRSCGKWGLPCFPLNGGPEGWDFPVDPGQQWSILFLTYHNQIVLQMTPLCLNMSMSEINERNKKKISKDKQFWYQHIPRVLT